MGSMAELDNTELAVVTVAADDVELVREPSEMAAVGAVIRGGFTNTSKLKVMNYEQAMKSADAEEWKDKARNEKMLFDKYKSLTAVKRSKVPAGSKIMTTVWAMKKKPNGTQRGQLYI